MARPERLVPESFAPAPVYGVTGLLEDPVADGAKLVPNEVPAEVGDAGAPVLIAPTAAPVVEALAELGQPAARPVTVLVWPATTTVDVVNCT